MDPVEAETRLERRENVDLSATESFDWIGLDKITPWLLLGNILRVCLLWLSWKFLTAKI